MDGLPVTVTTYVQPGGSEWTAHMLASRSDTVVVEIAAESRRVTMILERDELARLRSTLDEASALLDAAPPAA